MPDSVGAVYQIAGYRDGAYRGSQWVWSEGATSYVGNGANDAISSLKILPAAVDKDDYADLQDNPSRITFVGYKDGNFDGESYDLSSMFLTEAGAVGISYVGNDANDRISSFKFSVAPAPADRIVARRAARQKAEADKKRAQAKIDSDARIAEARERAAERKAAAEAKRAELEARPIPCKEMTIFAKGAKIWTATTSEESARCPIHEGVSICGADVDFRDYLADGGTPSSYGNYVTFDETTQSGRILTDDEINSVIREASAGDSQAAMALESVGISAPPAQGGGIFASLFS